jgi:predicted nucleotidyltransferase
VSALINLDKLPEPVRRKICPYLEKMIILQGDNLISVVIYGSAVGADYSEKSSDINLLLICESVDLSTLKKCLKLIREGNRNRIPVPLFLTRQYIETSADVFPIEFLEIKDNHLILSGQDLMADITVNLMNLRHQCEEQIKGRLVRIRQAYLEVGLKKSGVEALLKRSFASLLPVFRNLLRLRGADPPFGKEEVLKKLSKVFELEEEVFLTIFRDKQNDEKIGGAAAEGFLSRYLLQLEKLARTVDQIS